MDHCETRRIERRSRTFKEGKVVLSDWALIDCVVRDLNTTGARLCFAAVTTLPDSFWVLIPSDDMLVPAETRWTVGREAGVEFTGPSRKAPPRKW